MGCTYRANDTNPN